MASRYPLTRARLCDGPVACSASRGDQTNGSGSGQRAGRRGACDPAEIVGVRLASVHTPTDHNQEAAGRPAQQPVRTARGHPVGLRCSGLRESQPLSPWLFRVVLPISYAPLATLGILTFLASWNNFLWPLVVSTSERMYTLPVAVATLAVGQNATDYGLLIAGSTVLVLPVLVVFLTLQRYFRPGIATLV